MSRSSSRTRSDQGKVRLVIGCLLVSLAAPLVVLIAIAGLKFGVWDIDVAYDQLTWTVGLWLGGAGGIAALIAAIVGLMSPRRAGPFALVTVVAAVLTIGLYWREAQSAGDARPVSTTGGELGDVSTDPADPPAFSARVLALREADGADPLRPGGTGCAVQALPRQVAPGVAGYGLQEAGFTVYGFGVARADGSQTSFWFDRTHDAVIRIRPGRTDVRVAARDMAHDNARACRLALRIVENLQ